MIPLRYAPVTTRTGYSDVCAGYMMEKYFAPPASLCYRKYLTSVSVKSGRPIMALISRFGKLPAREKPVAARPGGSGATGALTGAGHVAPLWLRTRGPAPHKRPPSASVRARLSQADKTRVPVRAGLG